MSNKCPLCMEKLVKGECLSCGYKLPDEENISAVYDCEPSVIPEPAPVREIYPEHISEEIYPNRPAPAIEIKVRETEENKITLDKPEKNHYTDNSAQNGNPYAGYTPRGVIDYTDTPKQRISPFAQPSANSPYNGNTAGEFIKKNLGKLILSFIIPPAGFIMFFASSEIKKSNYGWIVLAAAIIGIILPP